MTSHTQVCSSVTELSNTQLIWNSEQLVNQGKAVQNETQEFLPVDSSHLTKRDGVTFIFAYIIVNILC